MALFSPNLRASRMTVGTAMIVLQMSEHPVIFGCAEVVAQRLCRCTAGAPALAVRSEDEDGTPRFALTEYGQQVKSYLEKWLCLREI